MALIADYLEYLKGAKRHAPGTLVNYARDLQRLESLHPQALTHELDAHDLRRSVATLHRNGLHGKSIAHTLSVWRGFYDWLFEQKVIQANPARGLRAPRSAKPLPKALSVDDAVRLAQHQSINQATRYRDHAIVELMYGSGLRRAELVSLDWQYKKTASYESIGWLDLQNLEVQVLGKGSKRRIVPIGEQSHQALLAWLSDRGNWLKPSSSEDAQAALFLGKQGERIAATVVYAQIKKTAVEAGVAAHVHPHMLRHSAASHLLQSSGDLRGVQEFLGHANISTTQIYTKLDWQHLAGFYDAAHPRAKRKT